MAQSATNPVYQDFDPFYEWSEDDASATLTVMLPGFTKEQLKVQVTSTLVLWINGERQIFENKRRRFAREFSIPQYCDTNDVSAKFEGGVLTIKFPKLITPAYNKPQQTPMPQKEKETQQDQVDNNQELPQKEIEPITSDEKQEKNKREESSQQKEDEPKPISGDKEKDNKTEQVVQPKEVAQKNVSTNGVPETTQERPKAKMTQRLKTRVLDFTVSLRSAEEPDVKQGYNGNKCAKLIKRSKIWMNIVVVILLVMVLGLYVKNAFRSSQLGGSKFEEF